MSSSVRVASGPSCPALRTAIPVSCQPKSSRRKATPPAAATAPLTPPVARPRVTAKRCTQHRWQQPWVLPVMIGSLGLLFLVLLILGGVYLCQAAAPMPAVPGRIDPLPGTAKSALPNSVPAPESPWPTTGTVSPKVTEFSVPPAQIHATRTEVEKTTQTTPKVAASPANSEPQKSVCPAPPAGEFFGTAVTFAASPKIAAFEAAKQHKLLFVLHVSGNFEDPGFT